MAQQELEPPQLHPRFEEMRRKRVAERISTLLIIRRYFVFVTITTPSLGRLSILSDGYGGRPRRV
jgi:uncharacterized membrane protein (DUF485 family)